MALSEFDLIQRFFAPFASTPAVVTGIGDDCAVLSISPDHQLCTSIDTMVEAVHFPKDAPPHGLAWRCLAAAASDLAACGARPLGFCLALTLEKADEVWLEAFASGLSEAAEFFQMPLLGGDTTRGGLALSVQVMGEVASGAALLRSTAKPGDQVWVTGSLGDARAALDYLASPPELNDFYDRYYYPKPPLRFAQTLVGLASAAIDISDGLLADLGHILEASGVGADIAAADLPLSSALMQGYSRQEAAAYALTGGDDYQLCFTAPRAHSSKLQVLADDQHIQLTCIGAITEQRGIRCTDSAGQPIEHDTPGYRHFS